MDKTQLTRRLHEQLALARDQRLLAKNHPDILAACMAVKQFQSNRLATTHADLLAAPNTHGAAGFFLEELYGARDLTQRDMDVERIVPTLERLLPCHTLETIADAITLDALSESLDYAMAERLGAQFSADDYVRAYREGTRQSDRDRQIHLVRALGDSLCHLVRIPFLATTLVMMRGPAKMAKLGHLQNFLERGFTTFKAMKHPQLFVASITGREQQISDNIFAGKASPFLLQE